MSSAFKCERCGRLIEGQPKHQLAIDTGSLDTYKMKLNALGKFIMSKPLAGTDITKLAPDTWVDLCDVCWNAFLRFWFITSTAQELNGPPRTSLTATDEELLSGV